MMMYNLKYAVSGFRARFATMHLVNMGVRALAILRKTLPVRIRDNPRPHPGPMASQARHEIDAPNKLCASRNVVPQERENESARCEQRLISVAIARSSPPFPRRSLMTSISRASTARFKMDHSINIQPVLAFHTLKRRERRAPLAINAMGFGIATLIFIGAGASIGQAEITNTNQPPTWLTRPMSLADTINLALQQNGTILKGKSDLEAQYGVVTQTRAVALPRLGVNGNYEYTKEVQTFPSIPTPPGFPSFNVAFPNQTWNANIQLTQTIYQGGQITSALRSAKLTKQQALLQYQTVIADSLLAVRVAYYDVLQAMDQVIVEEASVKLLSQQWEDQKRRYDAGTVPRFNVLQAEVAVSNEKPKLIQARNALRISKNNLVDLLGYHVPPRVWEDIPLQLTDKLDSEPYEIDLPIALAKALENRSELAALRKEEALRKEGVISAKGGYKPTLQVFGGYGAENLQFTNDPSQYIHGAMAGAQVSWNIFDGFLTQGKIAQAKAQYQGAQVDVDNEARRIELEVRTDYSNFIEAKETLESQLKVQEEAEEALRLATARNEAGTGTQLDVLQAQTSLTQARSTQVQALHDYDVARARVERAIGINIMQTMK